MSCHHLGLNVLHFFMRARSLLPPLSDTGGCSRRSWSPAGRVPAITTMFPVRVPISRARTPHARKLVKVLLAVVPPHMNAGRCSKSAATSSPSSAIAAVMRPWTAAAPSVTCAPATNPLASRRARALMGGLTPGVLLGSGGPRGPLAPQIAKSSAANPPLAISVMLRPRLLG
jgi:hypothetical protein